MAKAEKIDANTWVYRGFTITRNYMSPHGTGRQCSTQQGVCMIPASYRATYMDGDWHPSVLSACEHADWFYEKYEKGQLSRQGREVVEAAIRNEERSPVRGKSGT